MKLRFAIQHKEAGGYPISDEEFENDIPEEAELESFKKYVSTMKYILDS